MTITTEPTPLSYDGNDSTTEFAVTWKYFVKGDVVATLRDSAGVETVWVLDTDYSLTDAGVDAGGTLEALGGAPATGETLVLTLEPDNIQASAIPIGGPFPSTTVEQELDIAAQRDAKIENFQLRVMRVPKTDNITGDSLELPIDTERAGKFLAFDVLGNVIVSVGSSDSLGPVTAYINTLLDDANEAAARSTLGLDDIILDKAAPGVIGGTTPGAATFAGLTISGNNHLVLPQHSDAATPTLAFGDGDSGFYETQDDEIHAVAGGAAKWSWNATRITSIFGGGWSLPIGIAASATVPSLLPNGNDTNSGIGQFAADTVSLVAGGLEAIRAEDPADLAAAETSLWVYDDDGNAMYQVKVGANGSGSIGSHRMLQIADV